MFTGFQFRAAKGALGLNFKEIANGINVKEGTLIRFNNTSNLNSLKGFKKNIDNLKTFFERYNLNFFGNNLITLKINLNIIPNTTNLTRFQLKTARIATGLTQEELSSHLDISSSSISLLEKLENLEYIDSRKIQIPLLKKFFSHLGIIFPDDLTVGLNKDPQIILKSLK